MSHRWTKKTLGDIYDLLIRYITPDKIYITKDMLNTQILHDCLE